MLAPRGRIPSIGVLAPIFGDIAYACFIYRVKHGYRAHTPVSEFLRLINDNLEKHPQLVDIKTILDEINVHKPESKKAPKLTLCFKNIGEKWWA